MRRGSIVVAAVVLSLSTVAADGAEQGFEYGVAAGEVTSTSAILWTRASAAGKVSLDVLLPGASTPIRTVALRARPTTDLTVQGLVRGLAPGTRYDYRFRRGRFQSELGSFVTAPRATAGGPVRFALTGDADATSANGKPAFNRFQVYARMAAEQNDFNVNLGDTIYSDSEVGGAKPALSVAAKWAKYRLGLALPALQRLRGSTALYSHWDDHEFINDFSRGEHGGAIYESGVKAFRDYSPVSYSSRLGLFRSVRWGKNLELFFLDERSFRSEKADDVCAGDLAPTAPQAVRDGFSSLAPALRKPVPAACLAAIGDPGRTMLGARQFSALTKALEASTATFKVIVNEVPIQQYYALPYDRWEGYAAERERFLRFLQANVENAVFLTTDTHANLVNEVRYRTLGGPPESSGLWEVVTGPVATNTFSKEIDSFLGAPGAGAAIGAIFFKPPPPQGMGMRCVALDVYSYAQVTVTSRRLTVALRDARGNPVTEANGATCAPLVIRAR